MVTDKLIADQDSVTISDSIGDNTIALADGLQISSFAVANNALKLSLANGEEVTILNAGGYQFMTGGNLFAGTPGAVYGYADFVQDVLGVAGGLPSVGIIEGVASPLKLRPLSNCRLLPNRWCKRQQETRFLRSTSRPHSVQKRIRSSC